MKLYISPSMQEANKNPAVNYVEETQMNLIADILIPELIRHGQTIKRNNRLALGVEEICAESNAWGADYHIAIHSNAFKGTVRGCEVYCYSPTDTNRKGTQMAKAIYDSVVAIMPVPGRGIKSGATTMSEIAHTNAPAALIEIDYHDTNDGALWIMSHIKELAQALLLGILKQIGIAYIPVVDPKDAEIARLNELIKNKDIRIAALSASELQLQTENAMLERDNAELDKAYADCKNDLAIAKIKVIQLEEELKSTKQTLAEQAAEKDELQKKVADDKFKIDTIEETARINKEIIDNLNQQIAELKIK